MTIPLLVSLATLVSAITAAILAWLNYRNAGKLKVAEFRTKWIDEFRHDLADLYRLQYELHLVRSDFKKEELEKTDLKRRRREIYLEAAMLRRRLLLRLKPESDDPNEGELERLLRKMPGRAPEAAMTHRRELVEVSRKILKTEWNRVKAELNVN